MSGSTPRIVITRQREQGLPWVRRLEEAGLPVLNLPLLRYAAVPVDPQVDTADFDWILFASPQGVRAFVEAGLERGTARLGSLGTGTARTLGEVGLEDDLGIAARDGRELALAFVALAPEGARVLLPGPVRRSEALPGILADAGYEVTVLNLYETLPVEDLPEDPLRDDDLLFFCSPSAVRAFCGRYHRRPAAIAIGEATAAVTRQEGFATRVADTPDLEAMLRVAGLDQFTSTSKRESRS